MRLLVTGGCGFIGSNFIRYILEHYDPEFVTNVDALTYAGNIANVAGLAEQYGERYEFLHADIANVDAIDAVMQKHHFYAVVNFAAESHVDRSINSPQNFIHTNIVGTSVLLDAARRHGVRRFLQVSTDEVYGSLGPEGRFTETSPIQPSSPYSASKAAADLLALAFHKTYGEEVVITRCSNNYGPYQFPEKLIPLMVLNALRDLPLPVYGDGQNVRDWIHVDDHCAALVAVLLNGRAGEVYNVGADAEMKNLDLVHRILDHLGKPKELIQYVTDRLGHDRRYAIDSSKIRTELGWKPLHRPEKGIEETVDWYLANRGVVGKARLVKIALLGAGGRLGAALAEAWGAEAEIFGFNHAGLDLAKPGEVERVLGPLDFDVAVNCAALTNVDYCETHEAEAMRTNAEAVREIGELCARKKARCIHLSTDYVFDGKSERPYVETDAPRAVSIYGESKLRGEQALLETGEGNLVMRVSWVFGPHRASFVDGVLKRALDSDVVEAIGDKWSTPSYTLDLAAMLRPFLKEIPEGGILHASNTGACTWREYGEHALQCAARAGLPVKTTEVKHVPIASMLAFVARRPVYTVLGTEKLTSLTGIRPRSWQAAVEDYVANRFPQTLEPK